MAISVAVATLGCKVNQAEADELCGRLAAQGYQVTDFAQRAQVYVVNTCTVTHIADRKSRNLIRRACRANPQATILVAGCYAERSPRELAALSQVRVVGKRAGENVLQHVEWLAGEVRARSSLLAPRPRSPYRARALVKVQDGCDRFCAYCVVPLARGRPYSIPLRQVVRVVEEKVAAGYREVVLTGVNLGSYGLASGGVSLAELLLRVLETGVERLRLSSLHPPDVDPDQLQLWADGRLCRHFHLALQSGSDSVLGRMGRCYTQAQFRAAVGRIREALPEAAITTDLMVGFPGESQAEFQESYHFCQEVAFARMHVFKFSPRPGTAAARLFPPVPERTKAQRSRMILQLAADSAHAFRKRFLGRTAKVLFEEEIKGRPHLWRGLTDNYLEVLVESSHPLANQILPVKLLGLEGEALRGVASNG